MFRRPLLFQSSQGCLNAYSMLRLLSDHDHICLLFKPLQSISGLFLSNFRSEISSKSKFIIFPPTHPYLTKYSSVLFCMGYTQASLTALKVHRTVSCDSGLDFLFQVFYLLIYLVMVNFHSFHKCEHKETKLQTNTWTMWKDLFRFRLFYLLQNVSRHKTHSTLVCVCINNVISSISQYIE